MYQKFLERKKLENAFVFGFSGGLVLAAAINLLIFF